MSTEQLSLVKDILGITDPTNIDDSLKQAGRVLGHELLDNYEEADAARRSAQDFAMSTGDRSEYERVTDSLVVLSILQNDPRRLFQHPSTLTDWPSYEGMMRDHGFGGDGNARALLVGAISPISTRSFARFAQTVCGAGEVLIVDRYKTKANSQHGNFIAGDGLNLKLPDNSVDFVHTHNLLKWLTGTRAKDPHTASKLFLREAVRVLKPGGQLLMQERAASSYESSAFGKTVRGVDELGALVLKVFGRRVFGKSFRMQELQVQTPTRPTTLDYLHDPARNFAAQPTRALPTWASIFARKPR